MPGVSDDTVTGDAEADAYVAEPPATGEHAAEYELIGEPFAEPGVKLTVARDGPAVAATFVGAAGLELEAVGVTDDEYAEKAPQPLALWAWTRQRYAVPAVSDDTVTGDAEAEPYFVAPPATGEQAAE